MRIINALPPDPERLYGHVFHTSGISGIVMAIVCFGLAAWLTGAYVSSYLKDGHGGWMVIGVIWIDFWLGLVGVLGWKRFRASRRPSNWLLRLGTGGVLIQFRSFLNQDASNAGQAIIELTWNEMKWIRVVRETSTRDKGDDAVTETFTYLDIGLELPDMNLEMLSGVLSAEHNKTPMSPLKEMQARKQSGPREPNRRRIVSSGRYPDFPVRLIEDGVLRLRWNGVRPGIKAVISLLVNHVPLLDEVRFKTDSGKDDLSEQEVEFLIRDRLSKGDYTEAVRVVKRHYGYDTTRAMEFVDGLKRNDSDFPDA